MSVHPRTGLSYIHVIPNDTAYAEILRSYLSASWHIPWMSVFDIWTWKGRAAEILASERSAVVFWTTPEELPEARRCRVAVHYSEMIPLSGVFPSDDQKKAFDRFASSAGRFDRIFVHSPSSVEPMRAACGRPVFCVPTGYDPETLGVPDFSAKKEWELVFYGFRLTRREKLLRELSLALGFNVPDISGPYGRERGLVLSRAYGVLIIHHARDISFPSLRVWQAIASSAALFSEPGDAWPAEMDRHYVGLPWIDDDVGLAARIIHERLADRSGLVEMARRAHDELSRFTVDRAMNLTVEAFEA